MKELNFNSYDEEGSSEDADQDPISNLTVPGHTTIGIQIFKSLE